MFRKTTTPAARNGNVMPPEPPITDPLRLLSLLHLTTDDFVSPAIGKPLLVPQSFVRRMNVKDPDDPLLRQVLPSDAEGVFTPGFSEDPVGDDTACLEKGLIQKYMGRVLLTVTDACSLHCRFCFRRNRPADKYVCGIADIDAVVNRVQLSTDIREVILSGGDPLMLPPSLLERLLFQLNKVGHVARVRFHTRLPVADPGRIDTELMRVLSVLKKPWTVVWHTNHPQELNDETAAAAALLGEKAAIQLNQSVLLKGVNDRLESLIALSESLFEQRILPYYLHQLDRAIGTAHFEVPVEKGLALTAELRAACPGYLAPRYVREIAGAPSKTHLL